MISHDHPLAALSFVDAKAASLFSLKPTGDYATDCATGRQAAAELIEHMRATNSPAALPHIAAAVGDDRAGVAVGFWTGIAATVLAAGAR